ncbi:amidohydrolase [Rhodococcus rhodnii]|uniref:Amidohydrolase n=2 Tax=Rhodococcus rhodnii TaxID=38312 RepID=R7WJ76_9NOCA|nr:amidohydrolase family protein [Rhodococcus rhodnii]EOM75300.1 amidohydrolase [Rhodococcus rhodnii LMG 5362]TXG89957.1 amidohydrolase [Rhodococcus rhodnii]
MTEADDVAAVRAFWTQRELPGIVDVHTHFMPKNVMDKVWRYFDSAGPLTGREWPITYRHDEDTRTELLRAFGVRRFTAMIYPHKPDMARWLNAWGTQFAARVPDCAHTATFYPEPGAAEYVGEAIEAGARIFKSHIQVGDYSPADPLLDDVWGTLSDAGVATVIHCGSGPAPGRYTGPGPVADVLARHSRLRLVVAHMGMPEYTEFLDLADWHAGVMLDTTMAFTDFVEADIPFPREDLPRLAEHRYRILFGSDFPNIPYGYREALDALTRVAPDDEWIRAVVHDNGAALLGLGDDGP